MENQLSHSNLFSMEEKYNNFQRQISRAILLALFNSNGTWCANRGFNTAYLGAKLQRPFVDTLISDENKTSSLCVAVWVYRRHFIHQIF